MSAGVVAVEMEALARGVRAGDKTQVSRALNMIENRRPEIERQVATLLSLLGKDRGESYGHRIGLTGPPGVGKSSLVAVLARELRERGKTVGVVAVDPSSMRSGGALLGDRARMAFDPQDRGLFVRSLATQGALGGLAHATHAAVEVLAAAYDLVLIETVGVGQTEISVTHVSDTVVLVVQPGSGDVLQFLKAGVMEIPDLLVVNKADHGNTASRAASDLKSALSTLRQVGAGEGDQAVILTSARDRQGIDKLAAALAEHREQLGELGVADRRRAGHVAWSVEWLARRVGTLGVDALGGADETGALLAAAVRRGEPALSAAQALADKVSVGRR
ncbi:MAG: family ATPase [Myxococcaceae bacterium]|nr:family ATPase [Myxococcaceae bacterium]